MKYRSRSDIVGLLLDAANGGGATKTKLMYKAYLSFNQLKEYLTLLASSSAKWVRHIEQLKYIIG
jgi:predicted transcriptional regulator